MKKEKWLNTLFFETGLYELARLPREVDIIIKLYLQHNQTPQQIAERFGLSIRQVENTIRRGMKKVLLTSKDVLATKVAFTELMREREALQYQLAIFRERFNYEFTDEELTATYHRLNVPVTGFSFSGRAQTIFARSNIKTLNDLAAVTVYELKRTRNAGTKTVEEIVAKAKELGITIRDKIVYR